jgi:hypothetical protein
MSNEIGDEGLGAPREESAAGSLGREILMDIAMTTIGTGLVVLAIVLAAQGLSAG